MLDPFAFHRTFANCKSVLFQAKKRERAVLTTANSKSSRFQSIVHSKQAFNCAEDEARCRNNRAKSKIDRDPFTQFITRLSLPSYTASCSISFDKTIERRFLSVFGDAVSALSPFLVAECSPIREFTESRDASNSRATLCSDESVPISGVQEFLVVLREILAALHRSCDETRNSIEKVAEKVHKNI